MTQGCPVGVGPTQEGSLGVQDSSRIEDVGQETRGCAAGFAEGEKEPKLMDTGLQELGRAMASPWGTHPACTSLPAGFPRAFCDGNARLRN